MEDEIWKVIPDTDGLYFVSDRGRVKKVVNGVEDILKQRVQSNGNLYVTIGKTSKHYRRPNVLVKKLMFETFVRKLEYREFLKPLDGYKTNIDLENWHVVLNMAKHRMVNK